MQKVQVFDIQQGFPPMSTEPVQDAALQNSSNESLAPTGLAGSDDQTFPHIYGRLKLVAERVLSSESNQCTLTATGLLHEYYLKLTKDRSADLEKLSFKTLRFAARVMRQVLIDRARTRLSRNRAESTHQNLSIQSVPELSDTHKALQLLDLDEALQSFSESFPEHAELVRLRVFGGLSLVDAGECLDMSRAKAYRYWGFSKAWLSHHLRDNSRESFDS